MFPLTCKYYKVCWIPEMANAMVRTAFWGAPRAVLPGVLHRSDLPKIEGQNRPRPVWPGRWNFFACRV